MKREIYLFDFDGTLVDSMPTFGAMILGVLEDIGVDYPENVVEITTPLGYRGAAEYMITLGAPCDVESIVANMTERAVHAYESSIPTKEGVKEALTALRARGASLNILTASPHIMLDPCLKMNGIFDLFDNVWSCEDFGTSKSDKGIYAMAAQRLGVSVGEVTFVDDNLGAVMTAAAAGMRSVGIYDASGDLFKEKLMKAADGYIYRLTELL